MLHEINQEVEGKIATEDLMEAQEAKSKSREANQGTGEEVEMGGKEGGETI